MAMMIAITDYDGTLYRRNEVSEYDLAAIHEWRRRGNRFVIATGRDLCLTLHAVRRWNIPFDFLVCVSGAALYDQNLELVKSRSIEAPHIGRLLSHPAAEASGYRQLCADGRVLVYEQRESSFSSLDLPFEEIGLDEAMAVGRAQQISFTYRDEDECAAWRRRINDEFGDVVKAHQNVRDIDITAVGVDKAAGIDDMLGLTQWPRDNLFVIGDGLNDYEMICRYGGFTVPGAAKAISGVARAVYDGVGKMLDAALACPD